MSIAASAWARKQKTGSATMKAVLIAVADYADEHGCAWPSQKRLAEDTELSARSVRDALAGLQAKGFLRREERKRDDGSRASDRIILASGGAETLAGGGEAASGGVGKDVPGGGEAASPLTTFEPSPEPSMEEEHVAAAKATGQRAPINEAVSLWNETAQRAGFPKAQTINDRRRSAIRARLAECGGLDGWKIALGKAEASSFCRGDGNRGWVIDFDAFIQAKTFTKLMEGSFDDRPQSQHPGRRASGHHHGGARGFDAVPAALAAVARQRGLTDPGGREDLDTSTRTAEPIDADWWPAGRH